jgi:hypothetical protein
MIGGSHEPISIACRTLAVPASDTDFTLLYSALGRECPVTLTKVGTSYALGSNGWERGKVSGGCIAHVEIGGRLCERDVLAPEDDER